MKLYVTQASPFARKCRVLVREKGLAERVQEIVADAVNGDPALNAVNPMGQVPALVDDDGMIWTDSPLICARLDALAPNPRFIPEGDARWGVLRREVIADGMLELGVKIRLESLRPEGERSPTWLARWRAGLMRGLDTAEAQCVNELDLGAVATVCALTWLDLRFPDVGWRSGRPRLAAAQAQLEARDSFRATAPA